MVRGRSDDGQVVRSGSGECQVLIWDSGLSTVDPCILQGQKDFLSKVIAVFVVSPNTF